MFNVFLLPNKHSLALTFLFFIFVSLPHPRIEAFEEDLCTQRSCYPATGNLLIGRKHRLSATSTCGLHGVQHYCIVSHLEDYTKCFNCSSTQPWKPYEPYRSSHRIENVVSENYEERTRNWWQSENGVQNVSIRFDLEAEFHFTHLIMTFRSFRPAAMLIERSADFGKTWSVYRYFAYDCSTSFPGIIEDGPRTHTDIICTRRYSDMAPSTGGELVYKVISPHIPTEDPYAPEIAKLLKITNLRINFTKLHTLGDDLLDYRPEIDKKYYYAVYEIVVRGSCSCYGHAQRCIPDEKINPINVPDMVHGRCECTHNTQGLNCQECQDFYWDSPWAPAFGDQSNECRRCECNGHASRCHFDRAVYNASGFVSGGVCDDCTHNTQGKNCEQCKPYFYRDPQRPIHDPYVCRPCECDKKGSLYEGICEGEEDPARGLVAGRCYCKTNVDGPNCDRCKNGFWDLKPDDPDGCRPCTCNLLGTINNEGCDKIHGLCTCKPLVTGQNCDQCISEHYGLSEDPRGCRPCDCDIGGAIDNNCDIITGQCKCRENFGSRRCNTTESSFYCATLDYHTIEAEQNIPLYSFGSNTYSSSAQQLELVPREPLRDRPPTWTGEGFVRVREGTTLAFSVEDVRTGRFNLVLRYELDEDDTLGWEDIKVTIARPNVPTPDSICANIQTSDDFLIARLHPGRRYTELHPPICLETGQRYEIRVTFGEKRSGRGDIRSQALIDSLVVAPLTDDFEIFRGSETAFYRKRLFDNAQCRFHFLQLTPFERIPQECASIICPVAGIVFDKGFSCLCDVTGSVSGICNPRGGQCECKPNVVGRDCNRCAVGTFGFGPNGCSSCECNSVGALSNVCDRQSGQCECRERGITGRQCNECQPGFWSFPDCRTCQCNSHASICDQITGYCIDCRNLTDGEHCERCVPGYYGDPRLGVNLPCKACLCPGGPGSGYQHADTCWLSPPPNQAVVCNCRSGYMGERCDQCTINYWGNPREIGGSCERCDCNDNIDRTVPDSCDAKTGDCLKCLHNTIGDQCEHCLDGFFGDARIRTCQKCVCNHLGTNKSAGVCDRVTGQCPCLPNVIGVQCDECAPLHYDLASGKGCSDCACDPNGVIRKPDEDAPYLECNHIDGQCHCKPGRGGRSCSDCQDLYWGDPVYGECKRCECDPIGSLSQQCDRQNGTCLCRAGSGGRNCNECARGYTGHWPECTACGECFNNWDMILGNLRNDLELLLLRAANIEDSGVSSEYDDTFAEMESQIADIRRRLENINVTKSDVDSLKAHMEGLQRQIDAARTLLQEKNQRITRISADVNLASAGVRNLNESLLELEHVTDDLQQRADEVRSSDVRGAMEIIEESAKKSADAEHRIAEGIELISTSESDRHLTEQLLSEHRQDFDLQYEESRQRLEEAASSISVIEKSIPSLNLEVCGAESPPCDALCGGPSGTCKQCGGSACSGSVSKASQAREFAEEAEQKVLAKQREAEEILRKVRDALPLVEVNRRSTEEALQSTKDEAEKLNKTKLALSNQINETRKFVESERNTPADIASRVDQILNITIPFNEEQIRQLAENIRMKVLEIKDADQILEETRGNKTKTRELQKKAELANESAAKIHNITTSIKKALEEAEVAQEEAQNTLNQINENIDKAKSSLAMTDEEVAALEERTTNAETRILELKNRTDTLMAEYVKISSNSKSATASAQSAAGLVKGIETKHNNLKESFEKVRILLEQRETGNEARKERAEALRHRTTELLVKIKRSRDEKNALIERADALDVELAGFKSTIEKLSEQIEQVSNEIDRRVNFHNTCDV